MKDWHFPSKKVGGCSKGVGENKRAYI